MRLLFPDYLVIIWLLIAFEDVTAKRDPNSGFKGSRTLELGKNSQLTVHHSPYIHTCRVPGKSDFDIPAVLISDIWPFVPLVIILHQPFLGFSASYYAYRLFYPLCSLPPYFTAIPMFHLAPLICIPAQLLTYQLLGYSSRVVFVPVSVVFFLLFMILTL
jgi:hypothetical protein